MIKKIAHISDIHIRKAHSRNDEYKQVFENLLLSLQNVKPHRIAITGDYVNDYLDLQGEQLVLGSWFLNELAKIAPVRITRGNHDYRKTSSSRIDSVDAITQSISNPNIKFLNETGFVEDDNIVWSVWKHGEPKNSPWLKDKKYVKLEDKIYIDLFHETVNGSVNDNGIENNSPTNISLSEMKGDFVFLGHIHKEQIFNKDKKSKIPFAAYAGSLICQKFDEGDDNFHGYLLWDVENKSIEEIKITSDYTWKNIQVNQFTDYDDLDIDIDDVSKYMRVRINWKTLPTQRTKDNERKVIKYIKDKYSESEITIVNINKFIEEKKIIVENEINISDISDKTIQHNIFVEHLKRIGVENDIIESILDLDNEITSRINVDEQTNIEWEILKFSGNNFCSYENIDIDWRDKNGIFQITGLNTGGKTTILKLLAYIFFGKTPETEKSMKFGDLRFINNRNSSTFCDGTVIISALGEYYGIKRVSTLKFSKDGEINGCPTTLSYYKLTTPDDVFTDENSIDKLSEDIRNKTQKVIDMIIGSYENYMRTTMTTSDTLNRILSIDPAGFTDSLLYDSGLDIFDKKLNAFKDYIKEINNKQQKNVCDIDKTLEKIKIVDGDNELLIKDNLTITNTSIVEVTNKINIGKTFIEDKTKSLHKIDDEIYNLNQDDVNKNITIHNTNVKSFNDESTKLLELINKLIPKYDEEGLIEKTKLKDNHKQVESDLKIKKLNIEKEIDVEKHKIALLNGEILQQKQLGASKRAEYDRMLNSKVCPVCTQDLKEEQRLIIDKQALDIMSEMKLIGVKIKGIEDKNIIEHKTNILKLENDVILINEDIVQKGKDMENILVEIGELTNQSNDVKKRKEYQAQLDQIPMKIENENLKVDVLKSKIEKYNQNLINIQENVKTNEIIEKGKQKLRELEIELLKYNTQITENNNKIINNENLIKEYDILIINFKKQERQELIYNTYKDCVHRDGIPKQILGTHVIPKANDLMSELLFNSPFSVWLDPESIRLKMKYNNQDNSTIDAIGGSGKERTISSIILKYALNGINSKSKPNMLILDEVMGKLIGDSIEEFALILHEIKKRVNKIIIIEHNHDIDPDYIISVTKNSSDISCAEIDANY